VRPLLIIAALVAALLLLTLLPLIPDLTVIRQAIIIATSLAGVVLVGVNTAKRWRALPDLRGRIAASGALSVLLAVAGMLLCLALSPIGGLETFCTVRAVRLSVIPTGYPELHPDWTTYRFTRRCLLDDRPEGWFQQSRGIFLVGPRVPDQG
jgi:hypothetical protein